MMSFVTGVADDVENPVQVEIVVQVREPSRLGMSTLDNAVVVLSDLRDCLTDAGFIAMLELKNPNVLEGLHRKKLPRERLHEMLDLAADVTPDGESFLPEFIRLVLKDKKNETKFVVSSKSSS